MRDLNPGLTGGMKVFYSKLLPWVHSNQTKICISPQPGVIQFQQHYSDVMMSVIVSQITSLTIVYPTVYSGTYERIHQSSASLAFVRGIHRWLLNSPHKGPVTWKMFPFDGVIMSGIKGAEWSLIIWMDCWVKVFSLILDGSVGLWVGIQSAGEFVPVMPGLNPVAHFTNMV